MKFARYLEETRIPEWKKAYIDFKGLKKRIAAIRDAELGRTHLPELAVQDSRRTTSQPLADDHARQQSYGSVDNTTPRHRHAPSGQTGLNNLQATEDNVGQRPKPPGRLRSLSDAVLSRTVPKGGQNVERRRSFSRMVTNATRRRPQKVPTQPHSTTASLYASLHPLETSFFTHLDRELEKVDAFYNEHESLAVTKLSALKDQLRELQEHRRLFYEAQALRDGSWNVLPRALGEALGLSGGHNLEPTEAAAQGDEDPTQATQRQDIDGRDPFEYIHAKRKLKKAFQEFYRGLELLNDYRVLNLTGFRKALKKFEKVTRHPAQDLYMREKIQPRRFAFSGIMDDTMREVENIFAESFENGDRKKARRHLKSPFLHKSHHFNTFRSGVYIGVAIPAFVTGVYKSFQPEIRQNIPEWGALLEIYAVLFIPVIFSMLVGLNLLAWSRARINFPFIFEFDVRTAVDIREYFELPAILFATLSYAFWLSFLDTGSPRVAPTAWPAIWIGLAFVVLINPFPIFARSSRLWLLKNVSKLLISGKSRVEFTDFWMGDQFCSLVFSMGHLYTIVCAYSHDWHNVWGKCSSSQHWPVPFVLTALPSLIRMVQSVRRYYDSRLPTHLINGGKYLSSVVAYATYYIWRVRGAPYNYTFAIWCLFATFNSAYTSSWDLLMDWSLIDPHGSHRFLRSELIYTSDPWMYYFAIISNIIVRFIWLIYVPARGPSRRVRAFVAAILEILRRFQWNFYRLENEQIGNTDQYRATREVPLPYSARRDEDESDAEEAAPKAQAPPAAPRRHRAASLRMFRLFAHDRQTIEAEESAVARRISRHQGL